MMMEKAMGSKDPKYDFNGDGMITGHDLSLLYVAIGESREQFGTRRNKYLRRRQQAVEEGRSEGHQ